MKKTAVCLLFAVSFASAAGAPPATAEKFSLPGLDGKQISLEGSLGRSWVVLNFWARWCDSCKEEIPQLAALMKAPGAGQAVFIGVNVGDKEDKASKFAAKTGYPYTVALDKDKAVAKKYGVLGLPLTLIISKEGKVVFRGARPPATFDFTGK
jgi:peroxiredoxin